MTLPNVRNGYLVMAVVVIGLHVLPSFHQRLPPDYPDARTFLLLLMLANLTICALGALKTPYKIPWLAFAVLSVLSMLFGSAANPVAVVILLVRMELAVLL